MMLDLDAMWLTETFLQQEEEIEVGGYMWHGQNRQYCKRASGGVGLLAKKHLKVLPLRSKTEGVLWVEVTKSFFFCILRSLCASSALGILLLYLHSNG